CYARRVIEGWRPRRPAAFVAGPTRRGSRARPRPAPLPSGIDRRSPRTATPRAPGASEPPSTACTADSRRSRVPWVSSRPPPSLVWRLSLPESLGLQEPCEAATWRDRVPTSLQQGQLRPTPRVLGPPAGRMVPETFTLASPGMRDARIDGADNGGRAPAA